MGDYPPTLSHGAHTQPHLTREMRRKPKDRWKAPASEKEGEQGGCTSMSLCSLSSPSRPLLLLLPHSLSPMPPSSLAPTNSEKPSHIQTCARACVRSRATHSKARSGCHCPQPPVGLNTVTVQFHIPTDFEGGAECISAPGRWKGKGHRRLGAESG
jgi:hypothetical protein